MKANAGFYKTDWFLGVVVVLGILVLGRVSGLIPSLERKAYDIGVGMSSRAPSDKIAIIAIDDASISNIGRWPWPRDVHAKLTDMLAAARVKVIANTVFFFEPQRDPGLEYINKMLEVYGKLPPAAASAGAMGEMGALLQQAEAGLNTDRKLAESYAKAGNALLPLYLSFGQPQGRPDHPLPDFVKKNLVPGTNSSLLPTLEVKAPIEALGTVAAGLGALNSLPDADGGYRREPLALGYFNEVLPSFALMTAARSLNLGVADIKTEPGVVTLGKLRILTDDQATMLTYYYKDRDGKPAFRKTRFTMCCRARFPRENMPTRSS